jgi:putative ABC transport system permease protein
MSILRVFHLRQLRRSPLRTLLAAIALGAAVATSVIAVVVVASLDRSVEELLKTLGGPAPLRVVGPLTRGGVEPDVISKVAKTDGVAAAVPVVQGVVFAQNDAGVRRSVIAIGVDCRAEALFGEFGCDAELVNTKSNQPVLMSASLAKRLGPKGYLRTDVGRVGFGDAIGNDQLDRMNDGGVVVFELSVAQRVLERGNRVDAVYVRPSKGVGVTGLRTSLEEVVGEQNMVLLRDEPAAWVGTRGPLLSLLGLVVLVSLGLSMLLVYNIVALSLAERRRDIAIVSAVGASPSTMTRNILGESAILGLIGGAVGIAAGVVGARPMVRSIASVITEQATGMRIEVHVPVSVYVVGLLVGALTAVIASVIPARRAARLDLAAELHGRGGIQESAPRRTAARIVVLGSAAVGSVVLSLFAQRNGALEKWQPPAGGLALLLSGFLVFAVAGAIAPMLLRLLLRPLRSFGGSTRLSLANLVSQPRRTSVIAAAVAAAVGFGCVLGSLIPAIKGAVTTYDGASTADLVYVSSLPLNNASNVDARMSRETLRKLERIDGVAGIYQTRCSEVTDTQGVYAFCGFEGERVTSPVVMGDDPNQVLARGDAIVATGVARVRGLRPGDDMEIATPSGMRKVRVGAVWIYARDNGHSVTVSRARHEELVGPTTPHSVLVKTQPGVTQDELISRIEASGVDPDAFALSSFDLSTALADEIGEQVSPFWLMQRLMLFVALVGTLSTLLLVGVQRRRELGILGAVGFGPASLGRMTLLEAIAAGGIGALLGAIGSSAVFETLRNAAAVSVGARPPFRFEFSAAFSSIAIALVVVAIGGALPAWRTSRLQIVEAVRDE